MSSHPRSNSLLPSPVDATFRLAVVQFTIPGAKNGGSDKGPDGNRIDTIPIANGVIHAGGACDLLKFESSVGDAAQCVAAFDFVAGKYDALILRINPGQLSQGTPAGTQAAFDALMNSYIEKGKLIWSSPKIQTQMGSKDALVQISKLNCGLADTYAYYTEDELFAGFKKTCAFQPRVLKQNCGSAGEGIWLCWLWDKTYNTKVERYPATYFGEKSLGDNHYLKLMEMNDNHVEYHTVKEFMIFCVEGPTGAGAGEWKSTFPGQYLKGGKAAHVQLVDQRLLPRIDEGEVRILMAGDTCHSIIHKKPLGGGLSAVGGHSEYTFYRPTDAKYKDLVKKLYADIPNLFIVLGLEGEPLPLLWTCDFIPKNPDNWSKGPYDRSCSDDQTEYTVGDFNCSCVGISKLQVLRGGEKTLADVPDEDYFDACELTDLMGIKAIEMLKKAKADAAAKADAEAKSLKPAGRLGRVYMSKREFAVALFAEFVGTFLFQIFGGTKQVLAENGLVLAVCIVLTAKASGGNLNPAVSAGLAVVGALRPSEAVLYGVVQVLGAFCACILAAGVDLDDNLDVVGFGDWGDDNTKPGCHPKLPDKARGAVFVLEALGTYLLVSTVCATAVAKPGFGGLAPAYIGTRPRTERRAVALTAECLLTVLGSTSLCRYLDFRGRLRIWADYGRIL